MKPTRRLVLLAPLAMHLRAGALEAIPAPARSAIAGARLLGSGVYRWFGLRIYEARLVSPAPGLDPARPTRSPLALELTYARRLEGKAIAERSAEEMAAGGHDDPAQRSQWLQRMRSLFPDVDAGDRLLGLWQPGGPTRFFFNDKAIGAVDGEAFGEAFFGIWLDADTSAPALRAQLLGIAR